ncbi:MAG: ImmA/IrrE family metallo-endopeptidase [Vicinamibacterales bacterium]
MDPEVYARALLERLAVKGIPDVRQVAALLGVPVHERPLERCEGMLVRIKGTARGAIAVRTSIRENSRKLFTIAHELGHLLLPGHEDTGVCATETIESWASSLRAREREANAFAAELLMPAVAILELTANRTPSLALVDHIAETCGTSLTASAYRLVGLSNYSVALVWSTANRMVWARRSEEFRGWLRLREQLDSRTFASNLFRGEDIPPGALKVPADSWLERAAHADTLWEESRCLPSYNAVVTLLWTNELSVLDRDDDPLESSDRFGASTSRHRWSDEGR